MSLSTQHFKLVSNLELESRILILKTIKSYLYFALLNNLIKWLELGGYVVSRNSAIYEINLANEPRHLEGLS